MIAGEFDHRSPRDLQQLIDLLRADVVQAKVLAGGMTLVPMLNLGLIAPTLLISLRDMPELTGISEGLDSVTVGAMTRHFAVANDPLVQRHIPLLGLAAGLIGDVQVRNRGTIGGSLAHADPAANYLPAVIALNAELKLASSRGTRAVPARQFFLDTMTTALDDDEIIISVVIPKGKAARGVGFQKFTRVKGNFPIVCAAALIEGPRGCGRVVIGGITPVPMLIEVQPGESRDQMLAVAGSIRSAAVNILHDQNGDAEYKREMAIVFGSRALTDALHDSERKSSQDGQ